MKNGFTLIELMIVIAIIGILAEIALPAYRDYKLEQQGRKEGIISPRNQQIITGEDGCNYVLDKSTNKFVPQLDEHQFHVCG